MLPSAEFAKVTHFFDGLGLPTGGVVTYCVSPATSGDVDLADVQAIHEAFADNIMSSLTDEVALNKTTLKVGPDDIGPSAEWNSISPGTVAGTALAPHSAFLISKQTAVGGRRGKGRIYLPGCPDDSVDNGGFVSSGALASLQANVDAWLADLETAGVGYDTFLEHFGAAPPDPYIILSWAVQAQIATQRRRLRR